MLKLVFYYKWPVGWASVLPEWDEMTGVETGGLSGKRVQAQVC